ncbi:MAG: Fic family protein [Bacteriovoracaceae bacterium]|nr:Fic family protein [Bacteriovoracaceae bacterium]
MHLSQLKKNHWIKTHAEIFSAPSKIRTHRVICRTDQQRTFHFAEPEKIALLLESLEKKLTWKSSNLQNMADLADLLATFWFFMISIHPFSDGNGRTTQKIINQILMEMGHKEMDFSIIKKFLFQSYENDYPKLVQIFHFELRKTS